MTMRVKIYTTDDACYDISHCEECYSPSSTMNYIRVVNKECKYVFNMNFVRHIEMLREEEDIDG